VVVVENGRMMEVLWKKANSYEELSNSYRN